MRELGFAFVGALALIALGVCAARKADSENAWSPSAAYKAEAATPVQGASASTDKAVER